MSRNGVEQQRAPDVSENEQVVRQWYARYGAPPSSGRHDALVNPEVLFQGFAFDKAIVNALRAAQLVPAEAKVLDVGCGDGASLGKLLQFKFRSRNLYGIDLLEERIDEAADRYPGMNFSVADASRIPFEDETFDLVMAASVFIQISDRAVATSVASEMLRVAKQGGYLLLVDWRYGKTGYIALDRRRIMALFAVDQGSRIVTTANGALIPPIGRRISKHAPWCYFLLQTLAPFAVGGQATLLRKE